MQAKLFKLLVFVAENRVVMDAECAVERRPFLFCQNAFPERENPRLLVAGMPLQKTRINRRRLGKNGAFGIRFYRQLARQMRPSRRTDARSLVDRDESRSTRNGVRL